MLQLQNINRIICKVTTGYHPIGECTKKREQNRQDCFVSRNWFVKLLNLQEVSQFSFKTMQCCETLNHCWQVIPQYRSSWQKWLHCNGFVEALLHQSGPAIALPLGPAAEHSFLVFHPVTHSEVKRYLSDLAPGAAGPDSFSSSEVKVAAPLIGSTVAILFNELLTTGELPIGLRKELPNHTWRTRHDRGIIGPRRPDDSACHAESWRYDSSSFGPSL